MVSRMSRYRFWARLVFDFTERMVSVKSRKKPQTKIEVHIQIVTTKLRPIQFKSCFIYHKKNLFMPKKYVKFELTKP